MTTLFPKTTYLVSEALDRIGRHRFGCEWTGEESNARRLPEPGKVTALKGRAVEDPTVLEHLSDLLGWLVLKEEFLDWPDPDSEKYGVERAAYLRHTAAYRDLRDALRYEHVPSHMVTESGQKIDIPGHWLEEPMQIIIGAFLNSAVRSGLGLAVDEVKVKRGSSADLRQGPGFRWKDRRGKAHHLKTSSLAAVRCVLYIDQVALDNRLQGKEEGAATADPYKTGLQGKPTIRHLILDEFRRRVAENDNETSLSKEAQALCNWARTKHPKAPTSTARTVENLIRSEFHHLVN